MKLNFTIAFLAMAMCISCAKKDNSFLIEKGKIGNLLKTTNTNELETIFAADSIVKDEAEGTYSYASKNRFLIYDTTGKHLLTLTPTKVDSTEVIENIRVFDERYQTAKGLSVKSTFKVIRDNYKISRITNSLNNILVFVDEIDAYFVIDKNELPESLRHDSSSRIEEVQIPDGAKIKYFMLGWQ